MSFIVKRMAGVAFFLLETVLWVAVLKALEISWKRVKSLKSAHPESLKA